MMVLDVKPQGARAAALDAAEALFYKYGVQAVGMDRIRDQANVSLKRLYAEFGSKEGLVIAVLERRDERWRDRLAAYVEEFSDPREKVLAVFDWLEQWFLEPEFRGCAWINMNGELGTAWPAVTDQTRRHKRAFADYLNGLAQASGLTPGTSEAFYLLAEGAMVNAGIFATHAPAMQARAAAQRLLDTTSEAGLDEDHRAPREVI